MLNCVDRIFKNCLKAGKGAAPLELKEKDKGAGLRKVVIENVDRDVVMIHLNDSKPLCYDLKSDGGIQRRCDYILMTRNDDGVEVLYAEMKSESIDKRKIKEQFWGSQCFIEYCRVIAKKFFGTVEKGTWTSRYVVFHKGVSMQKMATGPVESISLDPGEPTLWAVNGRVRFKKLFAGMGGVA